MESIIMITTIFSLVQSKIDALPKGTEFDVKTLMGREWSSIQSKQSFGREFKKAIADGRLTGIIHDHLDNSPRRDIYKKTS